MEQNKDRIAGKNIFIARYKDKNGVNKTVAFNKSRFNQEDAEKWLNSNDIQNFLFFFEPYEPEPFGENGMLFKGDVGFDITVESLIPYVNEGKEIILDTFGGDLWESWKIYDAIKLLNINPSIGVLGTCASSGMQILLATENRWASKNSRGLIHNPWTFEVGDDNVMRNTAEQLAQEKIQLAELYSAISGDSQEEILDLMKKEIFLNSQQLLDKNFIKEIRNNSKPIIQNKKMENTEAKKKIDSISSSLNWLKNLVSGPKNLLVQDVNGVEIDFPTIETMEQLTVGLEATIDGGPATGDHVLEDGRTLVFESGELTEIKEEETNEGDEDMDALKQENADLKTENERLTSEVEANKNALNAKQKEFDTFKSETEEKVNNLTTEFEEFKKSYSNGFNGSGGSPEGGVGGGGEAPKKRYGSKRKREEKEQE